MLSLLLAEALRSRRGIVRVGPVPHATRILGGSAEPVNAAECFGPGGILRGDEAR